MNKLSPFLLLLLAGCAGGPDPAFVVASRATYEAIAPEYAEYVKSDPSLDAEQKARRQRTLDRWLEAIASREVRK